MFKTMNGEVFNGAMHKQVVQYAVEVLNSALEADPRAIETLIGLRVPVNVELRDHPTIQVSSVPYQGSMMGLLGILEGIFGIDEEGMGAIEMEVDEQGWIQYFKSRV